MCFGFSFGLVQCPRASFCFKDEWKCSVHAQQQFLTACLLIVKKKKVPRLVPGRVLSARDTVVSLPPSRVSHATAWVSEVRTSFSIMELIQHHPCKPEAPEPLTLGQSTTCDRLKRDRGRPDSSNSLSLALLPLLSMASKKLK